MTLVLRRAHRLALCGIGITMLLGVGVFSSCTKKDPVRLQGTIADVADSTQVLLTTIPRQNVGGDPVDTALVIGGKFSFTGTEYEDNMYVLRVNTPEFPPLAVYVGSTNAQITIPSADSNDPISFENGEHDDILNAYFNALKEFITSMKTLEEEYRELTSATNDLTPEEQQEKQKAIEDKYETCGEDFTQVVLSIAEENKDNVVSLCLLAMGVAQEHDEAIIKQVKEILEDWSDEYNEHPDMQFIRERITKVESIADGNPLLDFTAVNAEGEPKKLSEVAGQGKWVLLEFWASWCGYCRRANPELVQVYADYKDKGFEIYGLSLDRDTAEWKKAVATDSLQWAQFIQGPEYQPLASDLYDIVGIPYNVLFTPDGKIAAKGLNPSELRARLAEVLEEKEE